MIIDLSGSHGTGKTTLIDELMKHLDGTCIEIPSVSRTDSTLTAYKKTNDSEQLMISLQNWGNIVKHAPLYDYVLCTDLGIRSFAYTLGGNMENCTQRFHELATQLFTGPDFNSWFNAVFFYLPVEFTMEKDGFRPDDDKYRNDIDNLHKSIISRAPEVYTLRGSVEVRLLEAITTLILRGAKFKGDLFQPPATIQQST